MREKDEIRMCLTCKKIDCDNCLDSKVITNDKKRNKLYYLGNEGRSLPEWSRLLDISYPTLSRRIRKGISIAEMPEAKKYLRSKSVAA